MYKVNFSFRILLSFYKQTSWNYIIIIQLVNRLDCQNIESKKAFGGCLRVKFLKDTFHINNSKFSGIEAKYGCGIYLYKFEKGIIENCLF